MMFQPLWTWNQEMLLMDGPLLFAAFWDNVAVCLTSLMIALIGRIIAQIVVKQFLGNMPNA